MQLSYFDGHSSTFPTGIFLKSAREISNILSHQNTDVFNRHGLNEFFVFFGQFVDHNLVATPLSNDTLDIPVPLGDPYAKPGVLHFRRSVRAFVDADASSMRERPINVLSSPLDLSAVYGVSSERNAALRVLGSGKLKVSPGNMLPYNNDKFVNAPAVTDKFYLAGDHRANEHPVLTCLHTLFMREHNRWCDIIQSAYPSFSSEKVYQTARQINTAQFQKIVYEEFFPSIVGRHLPPYRGHKSSNPTVSDIFSSAAFRVGHTMVGNGISRIDRSGVRTKTLLTEMFFQPGDMVSEDLEDIVRGAVRTSAQEVDLLVHNALRNFLFEKTEGEEGFDLVAMNLQRGRDHALPTYNDIRERFGLRRAEKFSDINSDATVAAKLEKAYEDVVNVEAWPGMVAEEHAAGSGMGETMIRVWSEEFRRLRDGDQFYYREPSFVRELASLRLPGVVDIWRERNMFRSILLRNTDLSEFDLPSGSLFRPRY